MPKLSVRAGTTSKSVGIFIQDSSSTIGAGLTGLVFNTASLVAYWYQPGVSAPAAITLATLAAITTAWSSGGFKEADATNMPGHYRLDIPNAVLTGAASVVLELKGAANMAPCVLEIELTATDNQSSTAIRKNTALAAFEFPMVLADHSTPATGKTIAAFRSIDGAAFGACANAAAEIVDATRPGWYKIDLAAADLNGTVIALNFAEATCDATQIVIVTQP